MREAQTSALSLPNTGPPTTMDVGDPYDVHARDKLYRNTVHDPCSSDVTSGL